MSFAHSPSALRALRHLLLYEPQRLALPGGRTTWCPSAKWESNEGLKPESVGSVFYWSCCGWVSCARSKGSYKWSYGDCLAARVGARTDASKGACTDGSKGACTDACTGPSGCSYRD